MGKLPARAGRSPRVRAVAVSPWAFALMYLGWAYLWWIPVLRSDSSVWSGRNLVLFLVGGASPLLAAILPAWLSGGGAALADLSRRLVDVRRITLRWWLILLGFWLGFDLLMAAAAVVTG